MVQIMSRSCSALRSRLPPSGFLQAGSRFGRLCVCVCACVHIGELPTGCRPPWTSQHAGDLWTLAVTLWANDSFLEGSQSEATELPLWLPLKFLMLVANETSWTVTSDSSGIASFEQSLWFPVDSTANWASWFSKKAGCLTTLQKQSVAMAMATSSIFLVSPD